MDLVQVDFLMVRTFFFDFIVLLMLDCTVSPLGTFVEFCKTYVTFVSICHLNVLVERFVLFKWINDNFCMVNHNYLTETGLRWSPAATTSLTFPSLRRNWCQRECFVWNMLHNFAFLWGHLSDFIQCFV